MPRWRHRSEAMKKNLRQPRQVSPRNSALCDGDVPRRAFL
jgi:hypothetical protein